MIRAVVSNFEKTNNAPRAEKDADIVQGKGMEYVFRTSALSPSGPTFCFIPNQLGYIPASMIDYFLLLDDFMIHHTFYV